jgi:hypothetical protein
VTYKLAALRFRSVGERSARFQDLTLTFTAPTDGGSEPQDSVIWLRNGGGKSSILSLLYALLLPRAADFMGRSVKRSLTDYIDGGDTAHVIAVWEPAGASHTLLGEADGLLVTGAVQEWADLRRPAQPEATSVRFRRSAIAITAASTMPRGRLTYCSTSSAMREMSPSSTSATWKPLPPNDLRKVTSACGPTRDWSR